MRIIAAIVRAICGFNGILGRIFSWFSLGIVLVCFVVTHIYVAVREDIMSRQSIVSTMNSGWRTFKDSRPADDER